MARSSSRSSSNDCGPCAALAGGCGMCLLLFSILGGTVSLWVFSIMGLVQDWDKAKDCHGSALHVYMIVVMVLGCVSGGNIARGTTSEDTVVKICSLATSFVISTTIAIWGFIEVFDKSCPDLDHTLLWDMSIVTASFHSLTALICILFIVIPTCIACCNR